MTDVITRYKILFLFVILLIAPSADAIKQIILLPASKLILPSSAVIEFILSWGFYQILSIIWAEMNFRLAYNNQWDKYLVSLPIKQNIILLTTIFNLLFSNILIFLPFPLIFVSNVIFDSWDGYTAINILQKIIMLSASLVLLQYAWLRSIKSFFICGLCVNIIVIALYSRDTFWLHYSWILINVVVYLYGFIILHRQTQPIKSAKSPKLNYKLNTKRNIWSFIKIQMTGIKTTLLYKLATICIIYVIYIALIINCSNKNIIYYATTTFVLINAFILSNLYYQLYTNRKLHLKSFQYLPITDKDILKIDYISISSILLIVNLLYTVSVPSFSLHIILGLILSHLYLLLLYYPQVNFARHGSFMSLILMPGFIFINYLLMCFI